VPFTFLPHLSHTTVFYEPALTRILTFQVPNRMPNFRRVRSYQTALPNQTLRHISWSFCLPQPPRPSPSWGVISPSPKPQTGGPFLDSRPQLLAHYIRAATLHTWTSYPTFATGERSIRLRQGNNTVSLLLDRHGVWWRNWRGPTFTSGLASPFTSLSIPNPLQF
jgi:hypothetical protein